VISSAKSSFARARERLPFLDHVIRMYGRYQADGGDRLAAAVTFYWFLSLFPILLLAISVLGFVYGDRAPDKISSALSGYLPDQLVTTIGDTLSKAKGRAGVIGLIGLLLSGLGWVDGLREAIRSIWHQNVKAGNFLRRKVVDIVVLVGLFATIAASVVITGATTAATDWVIGIIGLSHSAAATVFTQVLAYLLSAVADTALFVYMFTRLPRVSQPITKVLRAAVFGAVGFEILKFAGAFYVARTTSKGQATYGTFAVVVGLLLFLNLISRLILLTAAFAVTKPYDTDVLPSGTASPEQAVKAGIPTEYADGSVFRDPDDPPALEDDGAPTPLQAAVEGQRPPKDEPSGRRDSTVSTTATYPESPFDPVPAPAPAPSAAGLRGEAAVRTAGRAGAAVIGMTLMALGVYVLRTFRAVLQRR
jgi:membrane protein